MNNNGEDSLSAQKWKQSDVPFFHTPSPAVQIRCVEAFRHRSTGICVVFADSRNRLHYASRVADGQEMTDIRLLCALDEESDHVTALPSTSFASPIVDVAVNVTGYYLVCCRGGNNTAGGGGSIHATSGRVTRPPSASDMFVDVIRLDEAFPSAFNHERWRMPERVRCAAFCADTRTGTDALLLGSASASRMLLADCRSHARSGSICATFEDRGGGPLTRLLRVGAGCVVAAVSSRGALTLWDLRVRDRPLAVVASLSRPSDGAVNPNTFHVHPAGRWLARVDAANWRIQFDDLSLLASSGTAISQPSGRAGKPLGITYSLASNRNNFPLPPTAVRFADDCVANDDGNGTSPTTPFLVYANKERVAICDVRKIFSENMCRTSTKRMTKQQGSVEVVVADVKGSVDEFVTKPVFPKIRWIPGANDFITVGSLSDAASNSASRVSHFRLLRQRESKNNPLAT